MLPQTVVQTLSKSPPFAIRETCDLLVQSLAFCHLPLQSRGALTHALVEFLEQRAQFKQQSGENSVGTKCHSNIPNTYPWNTRRNVGDDPRADTQTGNEDTEPEIAEP